MKGRKPEQRQCKLQLGVDGNVKPTFAISSSNFIFSLLQCDNWSTPFLLLRMYDLFVLAEPEIYDISTVYVTNFFAAFLIRTDQVLYTIDKLSMFKNICLLYILLIKIFLWNLGADFPSDSFPCLIQFRLVSVTQRNWTSLAHVLYSLPMSQCGNLACVWYVLDVEKNSRTAKHDVGFFPSFFRMVRFFIFAGFDSNSLSLLNWLRDRSFIFSSLG